jgi:DNA-binding CsgD family transcriptional regulator
VRHGLAKLGVSIRRQALMRLRSVGDDHYHSFAGRSTVAWLRTGPAPLGREIVKDNGARGLDVGRRRSRTRIQVAAPSAAALLQTLTPRELEVLELVASGQTSSSIGGELGIALPTVKRHLVNIYDKLGTANRVQASNLYHLAQLPDDRAGDQRTS